MAIHHTRCVEGVSSVLVGMRQPAYVDDILETLKHPEETVNQYEILV